MTAPKPWLTNDNTFYNEDQEEMENQLSENEECVDDKDKYIETLPLYFKSLINHPIELTGTSPESVIEILGEYLGVYDFKTNMASFWFLDILSLQVLRYESKHDAHYRSVFVSWLVGEFQVIRKLNPSRKKFFNEMNAVFCSMMMDINSNKPLLYWEEMFPREFLLTDDSIKAEYDSQLTREYFHQKYFRKFAKLSSEDTKTLKSGFLPENSGFEVPNLNEVFQTIVDASFEVFGNEFRYLLIQEVYVNKIEQLYYVLPYTLYKPRKIKEADSDNNFQTILKQKLDEEFSLKKEKRSSRKSRKSLTSTLIIDDTIKPPPPSLSEEEAQLMANKFILPLSESIEAQELTSLQNA